MTLNIHLAHGSNKQGLNWVQCPLPACSFNQLPSDSRRETLFLPLMPSVNVYNAQLQFKIYNLNN